MKAIYVFKFIVIAPLLAIPAMLSAAVPGTLDSSFSSDGKLITEAGNQFSIAEAVIQQTDRKLIAAGRGKNSGSNGHIAVVRYNSNGSLDTSFSGDGIVNTFVGAGDAEAFSVAQQSDSKIVVAGRSLNASALTEFTLVRYTTNGEPDSTFDGDGRVTTQAGVSGSGSYAILQDSSTTLTAAGYSNIFGNDNFALVRYNLNGSLNNNFGSSGIVSTDFGNNGDDEAFALIQQSDGKLVAAGYSFNGTNDDFAIARYNANGSLDTSFSGDGKVRTEIGSGLDRALSVIQQSDGKLVAAGYSTTNNRNVISLVRYNTNGTLDIGFSGDGKVTTTIGLTDDKAYKIIELPEDKLLVAGYTQKSATDYDFVLVRYNSNGSLDKSFSGDGILTTSFAVNTNLGIDQAFAAVLQSFDDVDPLEQPLVLAGTSDVTGKQSFALARYLLNDEDNDGELDSEDNCLYIKNPDQANFDGDELGDACDSDDDNDGVPDSQDDCPFDPTDSIDTDHDLICNNADHDDDNDGVLDGDDSLPLVGIIGAARSDLLGYSVANAGDIDKDGFDDIIVGSPKSNPILPGNTRPSRDAGAVTVYSGKTALPFPNLTFTGDAVGDEFGNAVSGAGDVNHDTFPDILIGAHKADVVDPGTQKILKRNAGRAVVYSGLTGEKLFDFYGEAANDRLGISVAIIGDTNGDGYSEVAAGAWKADRIDAISGKKLRDTGAVYLYSGQSKTLLRKFDGENKGDYFGFSVSSSDVNNDSKPDIVVGAYGYDAITPLNIKLRNAGGAYIFSGADYTLIRRLEGAHKQDRFGFAVAGIADINEDAHADVLVGAPREDALNPVNSKPVNNSGTVRVYSGDDGSLVYPPVNSEPQAGALYGSSVSKAGDFNNDNIPDFVVGAYQYDAFIQGIKQSNTGKVTVNSGDDGIEILSPIFGRGKNNQFGFAVSGGGNQNSDQFNDIIVGAPKADPHEPDTTTPVNDAGVVEIITGHD